MLSLILGFFTGNRLASYLIAVIAIIVAFSGTYMYGKHRGAVLKETELKAEFADVLKAKLAENAKQITTEYDARLKAQEKSTKTEIIFKDRIVTVQKIVQVSKALNNVACIPLEKVEIEDINKSTEELK